MIDTHAHLDFKDFDEDREEVILRAFDNGVKNIINIGVDIERSRKSIELAEKHQGIFASVGMHPENFTTSALETVKQDWVEELEELAKSGKVVAIGETGLDYSYVSQKAGRSGRDFESARKLQIESFIKQIDLAAKLKIPVIVHCRNAPESVSLQKERPSAWADLFDIVSRKEYRKTGFVLHCYSGSPADTEKFLNLPTVSFSFSGNITYSKPKERAEKLGGAVKMVPIERLMLDSDCPFLAPQEFRGKRNEPAYVRYIAEKIAEIKGISVEKVEQATDENAEKFFALA